MPHETFLADVDISNKGVHNTVLELKIIQNHCGGLRLPWNAVALGVELE